MKLGEHQASLAATGWVRGEVANLTPYFGGMRIAPSMRNSWPFM